MPHQPGHRTTGRQEVSYLPSPTASIQMPIRLETPSYMSAVWKEGYNRSLYGVGSQLFGGEKYDLSGFQGGVLFDVAASIVGFTMDIPAYVAGGGVGSLAFKQLAKTGAKEAVKRKTLRKQMETNINDATRTLANNGANPTYLSRVNKQLKKTFLEEGDGIVFDSSGFALISGSHEYLNQKITGDDVEYSKIFSKALVGAASFPIGRATGVAAANAFRGKVPSALARGVGEGAGFTMPYAWEQGELLPSPEDFAVVGGILGAARVTGVGYQGFIKNQKKLIDDTNATFGNNSSIKFKDRPDEIKRVTANILERRKLDDFFKREFYDDDGARVFIEGYDKQGRIRFRKEQSGIEEVIDETKFYEKFKIENSLKSPRFTLVKSIGDKLDNLGIVDDNEIRTILFSLRGGNVPKNLGPKDRGFGSLTNKELYQINKKLDTRMNLENISREVAALEQAAQRNYMGGPFGSLQKALDTLTIDGFTFAGKKRTILSSLRSVEKKLSRPGITPEARYMAYNIEHHSNLQASIVSKIAQRLQAKGLLQQMGDEDAMRKLTGELEMNKGLTNTMSDGAKELRLIYNDLFNMAKQEGLDVVGFEQAYAARFMRSDIRDIIKDVRAGIMRERPDLMSFDSGIAKLSMDKDSAKWLANKLDKVIEQNKDNPGIVKYFETLRSHYKGDDMLVLADMDRHIIQTATRPFNNISKTRTANISWVGDSYDLDIFETNAVANIINYSKQMANQISTKRFFGENFDDALNLVDDIRLGRVGSPDAQTADTLTELLTRVSGAIELDPMRNFKNKDFIQGMVDFQVASKIGGGLATLVNITQPLISSLLLSNFRIGIGSYIKRFVSGNRKDMLNEMGFHKDTEFLKTIEVLAGNIKREETRSDNVLKRILQLTGFTGINRVNLETSASIGIDTMRYLNRVANGESVMLRGVPLSKKMKDSIIKDTLAGQSRTAWAKRKLFNDYGVTWTGKKELGFEELQRGAIKFSKDSQLQRNLLKEPLFMTEPMVRPFIVLKTFGFKQAKLIKDVLTREVQEGNVLPVLRLAIGAGIGGKFILQARELIQNLISGKDEYDWNKSKLAPTGQYDKDAPILERVGTQFEELRPGFFGGKENYKRTDYWLELLTPTIEEVAAVGSMGVVTDFMAAESVMDTAEFIVTPVILDDVFSIWNGVKEIIDEQDDYGIVGATRRNQPAFTKLLGSNLNRMITRGVQSQKQYEDKITYQRNRVQNEIIKDILKKDKDAARKKLASWNRAHPDQPILEPDALTIYRFVFRQQQKKENQ